MGELLLVKGKYRLIAHHPRIAQDHARLHVMPLLTPRANYPPTEVLTVSLVQNHRSTLHVKKVTQDIKYEAKVVHTTGVDHCIFFFCVPYIQLSTLTL